MEDVKGFGEQGVSEIIANLTTQNGQDAEVTQNSEDGALLALGPEWRSRRGGRFVLSWEVENAARTETGLNRGLWL